MLRVAKLEVYMLSACLEISTGTASSARLLSTFRTLRRVVQEGARTLLRREEGGTSVGRMSNCRPLCVYYIVQ